MGMTKERKQELLELKRKKNNERRKRNYEKQKILKQEGLKLKAKKRLSDTYEASRKRKYREEKQQAAEDKEKKKAKARESNRKRQQRCRNKKLREKRSIEPAEDEYTPEVKNKSSFQSKHQKFRLKKKLNKIIPVSPTRSRKVELIESFAKSPKTLKVLAEKGFMLTDEEVNDNEVNKIIVDNLKDSVKLLKSQSAGTMKEIVRKAYRTGLKMATLGCKEQKAMKKVSKRSEVRPSIVSDVIKSFQEVPDPTAWLSESRNSKSNKLTEESTESIRKFWHANSRPTGDKRDVVRKRIGLKQYTQHPRQILEKTQTEL